MLKPIFIRTPKYYDNRGYLIDISKSKISSLIKYNFKPKQTLIVKSKKGTIRGLHGQFKNRQNKLITVLQGEILDVVVDINISSKNYGKIEYFEMTSKTNKSLFIPHGFLHGYQVISNSSIICYSIDSDYKKKNQISINPLDADLKIKWIKQPLKILSKKDNEAKSFRWLKKYL